MLSSWASATIMSNWSDNKQEKCLLCFIGWPFFKLGFLEKGIKFIKKLKRDPSAAKMFLCKSRKEKRV